MKLYVKFILQNLIYPINVMINWIKMVMIINRSVENKLKVYV